MKIQTLEGYKLAAKAVKEYYNRWGNERSTCPFCSGSKIKPFVRTCASQDCSECNDRGQVTNNQLVKWGLKDPLITGGLSGPT